MSTLDAFALISAVILMPWFLGVLMDIRDALKRIAAALEKERK